MKHTNRATKRAFTLIELLIVIAIIGILFVVLVSKVDFATDKAKATGVQTDFRSFQLAFEAVSRENAGFASLGWDTGDENGNRKRDSYDEGDTNTNNIMESTETWTGHKVYGETWTGTYTLVNPDDNTDKSAFKLLEDKVNANLDPKLHITITPEENAGVLTGDAKVTMANAAKDPWKNEYHGVYITNAQNDKADRGAFIIYSNGANGQWGSEHDIANGMVSIIVPGNNVRGKDDMSIVVCYSYANGYGETKILTTGFSNNQKFLSGGHSMNAPVGGGAENGGSGNGGNNEPVVQSPSATFTDGTTLTWDELILPENGTKYGYRAAKITNTSIGDYTFYNCTSLASVVIPDSVITIAKDAFRGCTSLTNVVIPDSVISIGGYAFRGCKSLVSVTIPDSVTTISDYVFEGCSSLVSVVIGNSVTSIGSWAFSNCTSLAEIVIPDSVTSIGDYAFYYCSNLTSVVIGDSITSIGSSAFSGCSSLTSVTIPDSVTSIGKYAFSNCKSLVSVTIPDSVTAISDYMFEGCSSLVSVVIGNSVTSIGVWAFEGCSRLTSITIPDSVTSISTLAFRYCSRLTDVYYTGSEAQWTEISIGSGNENLTGATRHYNYQKSN